MILLIILICAIVIGFGLIWLSETLIWSETPTVVGVITIAVSLILLISCGLEALTVEDRRAEMYEEYESIIIYQSMVEESSDLMLHWRHNNRVKEWNKKYENYEKGRENPFCGLLFYPNIYKDCSTIEFESPFESQFVN